MKKPRPLPMLLHVLLTLEYIQPFLDLIEIARLWCTSQLLNTEMRWHLADVGQEYLRDRFIYGANMENILRSHGTLLRLDSVLRISFEFRFHSIDPHRCPNLHTIVYNDCGWPLRPLSLKHIPNNMKCVIMSSCYVKDLSYLNRMNIESLSLTKLEYFDKKTKLVNFPGNLKELELKMMHDPVTLKIVPPGIQYLSLFCSSVKDYEELKRFHALKCLGVNIFDSYIFEYIPSSLETLEIVFDDDTPKYGWFEALSQLSHVRELFLSCGLFSRWEDVLHLQNMKSLRHLFIKYDSIWGHPPEEIVEQLQKNKFNAVFSDI